jgi:hypothetical protein
MSATEGILVFGAEEQWRAQHIGTAQLALLQYT